MTDERRRIPAPAVDLYTRFIHGEIDRRAFVRGVSRYAVAGLTASTIIEALMPNYALGQQVSREDERIRADYVTIPTENGHGSIRGYLVRPFSADSRSATPAKLPGVIVIHENRGLNPHTEDVARRFALANFMAFAPDTLTSVGGYPGDDFKGGQLFAGLDREKMTQDLVSAARWLRARPDCTGKIASTGFCFGGAQTNALAGILGPELAAAAPFYGGATPSAAVGNIRAAVLIHHGALDTRLAEAYPAQEADLKAHGVTYEGHLWPESVHGFFNDATPERYNPRTAAQAWDRTIEWFNTHTRDRAA
ncbi:dienelactone hydrolase family protein [Brevundimonas sp. VNH65]|uniref:dienelactone hydrolase family protein n=1 Tax=Brevundimonas sp. VNH65 TaxID=3400917 RepID=UPI003C00F99E